MSFSRTGIQPDRREVNASAEPPEGPGELKIQLFLVLFIKCIRTTRDSADFILGNTAVICLRL